MNSNLHQAQSHEILRSWQSQRNDISHHKDFVLPMFIGNSDDNIETIEAMPGVYRYGINRAIEYLEPLVYSFGLRSVLLFPVVAKSDQLNLINAHDIDEDDAEDSGRDIISSSESSTQQSSSSNLSDDDQETSNLPARLLPVDESSNSQNPFLNQDAEEEDHLLSEQIERAEVEPVSALTLNPDNITRTASKLDIRLIKGLALSDENNPVLRLIPMLRVKFPQLLIICDVCLCAFTSTGHCCLFEDPDRTGRGSGMNFPGMHSQPEGMTLNNFPIANKLTCQYLAALSVEYAQRGCNVIAPSDMMDGRISIIREKLNENKMHHVSIMSYSAKFASAFYGPFRQATNNAPEFGDRRAYQLPAGSRALALRAVERDILQGADFIMVKPAGPYLDIVRDIKEMHPSIPLAVYQVSGEYSILRMAAQANLLDLKLAVNEMLTAFRRAGATIIISYFTPELLKGEL